MAGHVKIKLAHQLMMGCWMVSCEIITMVLFDIVPEQIKLALCDPIRDPMIAHIKILRTFYMHLDHEDFMSWGVVCFD
jgi:hypothetical protein